MITIHHLARSQSERIVWLCEELAVPYELEWYDRLPSKLAPPEYLQLHPVATAPTIRDGDLVLCESVAIIEYIVNRHGGGRLGVPVSASNYPDYLYWMSFSTSFLSTLEQLRSSGQGSEPPNVYLQAAQRRLSRYTLHLQQRLEACAYLAGPEFTAADVQNFFTLTHMLGALSRPITSQAVRAYVDKISDRPAYRRAMALAGFDAQRPRQ